MVADFSFVLYGGQKLPGFDLSLEAEEIWTEGDVPCVSYGIKGKD